ncbi:hypothetical protein ARMGADRAFT_590925 [Armillaria gallica]|uniref:Uncharacterized protein n=1 Tax=Armillaria gallica TaxID=47427 RepID=A0A2H3CPT3_ARMGA|nr:hypothetical protein ARMGADRAFT_590925 [Armillaria gallica]
MLPVPLFPQVLPRPSYTPTRHIAFQRDGPATSRCCCCRGIVGCSEARKATDVSLRNSNEIRHQPCEPTRNGVFPRDNVSTSGERHQRGARHVEGCLYGGGTRGCGEGVTHADPKC